MTLPLGAICKPIASYETSLAADIAADATSLTVVTATDDVGNAISGVVGLTIDGEFIVGTKSGTTVSSLLRGIDPQDGTTERTALKAKHVRGTPVVITDAPFLAIAYRLLNGDEGFPNKLKYASAPTFSDGLELVDKTYADALTFAGAPDGSETQKGLFEASDSTETANGDDTGTTTAPLVVRPSKLAEVIQKNSYLYALAVEAAANTYTGVHVPAIAALTTGMRLTVKFPTAVTGAATYNPNGLGAKSLKKYAAGAIADPANGDIIANQPVDLEYDGTNFVMMSPGATTLTPAIATETAAFFGATDITGAEAEMLTDETVLTAKHYHKRTFGVTTVSNGSTTQTIAHGLGSVPKKIRLRVMFTVGTTGVLHSDGIFDGTNYATIYGFYSGTHQIGSSTSVIALCENDADTGIITATAAIDGTNITLTWSSTAASGGVILWEAEV